MKATPDWKLWQKGIIFCGVDEVGRGALAGPVFAAAVILPPFSFFPEIKDSKQLTPKARERFYSMIIRKAIAYGIGKASVKEIDKLNIRNAAFLAMQRAIENLKYKFDLALIDGFAIPHLEIPNQGIINGDEKSLSIACASIIAKVSRDRLMARLHQKYPAYNFIENKGYPTEFHRKVLMEIGPSAIHRKGFTPVRLVLEKFQFYESIK
ncbi:MAG: ribonuclease HII [candidate division WOR-3 bacterium]|nr:ribonuclease HII [candidate division WOR-3 bacterium]